MKIINKTNWETRGLRAIISRCIEEVRKAEKRKLSNKELRVTIVLARSHFSFSGSVWEGRMTLRIGKGKDMTASLVREEFAKVVIHELYHCLGYRHNPGYSSHTKSRDFTNRWNVGFVVDIPVVLKVKKEKKVKPVRDLQAERYQQVLKKVKEYEIKVNRSQRALKKWREKQRYYERVLSAAGRI